MLIHEWISLGADFVCRLLALQQNIQGKLSAICPFFKFCRYAAISIVQIENFEHSHRLAWCLQGLPQRIFR